MKMKISLALKDLSISVPKYRIHITANKSHSSDALSFVCKVPLIKRINRHN